MTRYYGAWFKTKEEAQAFVKKAADHKAAGVGQICSNVKYSHTKEDHLVGAAMFGFDPEEYHYSVQWNRRF